MPPAADAIPALAIHPSRKNGHYHVIGLRYKKHRTGMLIFCL